MTALHKIAHRILSVGANVAPCERLFGSLGNILTKLRNRIRDKTLLFLAEPLVRDNHLRNGELKERLKRQLDTDRRLANKATGPQPTPTAPPIPTEAGAGTSDLEPQSSEQGLLVSLMPKDIDLQ